MAPDHARNELVKNTMTVSSTAHTACYSITYTGTYRQHTLHAIMHYILCITYVDDSTCSIKSTLSINGPQSRKKQGQHSKTLGQFQVLHVQRVTVAHMQAYRQHTL